MSSSIVELIQELQEGRMIILTDDEARENEGDLILPAQFATPEKINFMSIHARGLICLSLQATHVDQLQLPLMVTEEENQTPNKTAFTVSIEAAVGVTTGISAADRARTIQVASHPDAAPEHLHKPGHIFPLRAHPGGVLKRAGHTEGSIDLCRLAGLWPAAVICEIINDDGSMARTPDLMNFSKKHQIKMGTIESLINHLQQENLTHETKIENSSEKKSATSNRNRHSSLQ